jgi:hypothetical protein
MFLRCTQRIKDGKVHRYWSIVETRRTAQKKVVQRQVLYLGEINDTQKAAWVRSIEVLAAVAVGPVLASSSARKPRRHGLVVDSKDPGELSVAGSW